MSSVRLCHMSSSRPRTVSGSPRTDVTTPNWAFCRSARGAAGSASVDWPPQTTDDQRLMPIAPRSSVRRIQLRDREHTVEGNFIPVLLLVGYDDAVVHAPFDQLFENPEQMIRRHTEHRRAEAPELIQRDHRLVRRDLVRKPVHEVDFRPDGP